MENIHIHLQGLLFTPPEVRGKTALFLRKLLSITQPGRYVGGELGIVRKEPNSVKVRIALCYPDIYEIGMANTGISILYERVNQVPYFFAERVFAPWPDMERLLRAEETALFTLETYTPLAKMDVVGFNHSHELLISNILNVLQLGQISVLAAERTDGDPIVIFGGSAVFNPAPYEDFADAFFIGEGEEAIIEILSQVETGKEKAFTRKQIIQSLCSIQGIYIPQGQDANEETANVQTAQPGIKKRHFSPERIRLPEILLVPNVKITQSRLVLEMARGCGRGCRFCQAGFIKRPLRNFKPPKAQDVVQKALAAGWDEISLNALSVTDYPYLAELVRELAHAANPKGLSINLPSLRLDTSSYHLLELTGGVRKSSLTFAMESGSEYIREVIRKDIREEDLYHTVDFFYRKGWDTIKIYFMLGLPNFLEVDECGEIIRVLGTLAKIARGITKRKKINVTLSPFVPKAHTPFQWLPMKEVHYFQDCLKKIKGNISRQIQLSVQNPQQSILEGALARGGKELGPIIFQAYSMGARFDSWSETFRFDFWNRAFELAGISLASYAARELQITDNLAWDHINPDKKNFLSLEYVRARNVVWHEKSLEPAESLVNIPIEPKNEPMARDVSSQEQELTGEKFLVKDRWILPLAKQGTLRYISHLDFCEMARKSFRRAGLPLTFARGFRCKEKIEFPPALSLGISSTAEPFAVELYQKTDLNEKFWRETIEQSLPEGTSLGKILNEKISVSSFKSASYRIDFFQDLPQLSLSLLGEEIFADWIDHTLIRIEKRSGKAYQNSRQEGSGPLKITEKPLLASVLNWQWDKSLLRLSLTLKLNSPEAISIIGVADSLIRIGNPTGDLNSLRWFDYCQVDRNNLDEKSWHI
jgi:radical SAM family uncharacterized protein/radical SAM-linked protein